MQRESLLGFAEKAAITDEKNFPLFHGRKRYDGESPRKYGENAYYSRKLHGQFSEHSGCMETFIFRVGPYLRV